MTVARSCAKSRDLTVATMVDTKDLLIGKSNDPGCVVAALAAPFMDSRHAIIRALAGVGGEGRGVGCACSLAVLEEHADDGHHRKPSICKLRTELVLERLGIAGGDGLPSVVPGRAIVPQLQ